MIAFLNVLTYFAALGLVAAVAMLMGYAVMFVAASVSTALSDAWESHLLRFLLKEWRLLALCIFLLFVMAALSGCESKPLQQPGALVCHRLTGERLMVVTHLEFNMGMTKARHGSGSVNWYADAELESCQ